MRNVLSFASLLLLLGCTTPTPSTQPLATPTISEASPAQTRGTRLDFEGQFVLSAKQPDHQFTRVRLISVGNGRGTVIQHLDTQRYAQAVPEEFFICDEFGTNRLKLLSASQDAQEAWFAYKWTEWR